MAKAGNMFEDNPESTENQTQEKIHIIGTTPAGMAEEIRAMSLVAKKQGQPGMLWNDDNNWHTANRELAEAVHQKILERQPRFYIEGNTFMVRDELASMKDDNGKRIAFLDKYKGAWYALTEENRNRIISEIDIPSKRGKLYLEPADSVEREAIFQCRDKFKDIREPDANGRMLKTFSFDETRGLWYTRSQAALEKAKAVIAEKMSVFQAETSKKEHPRENGKDKEPKQKIPLRTDGIPSEELRRQMKEKGCRPEGRTWFAPNPRTAKEVQKIIDESPKHGVIPAFIAEAVNRAQQVTTDLRNGMGD
jgi:hypothetical protein